MSNPPGSTPVQNAMSVDVEDWFQVQAFADSIPRDEWDWLSCRVEANTEQVLERFAEAGVRGVHRVQVPGDQ